MSLPAPAWGHKVGDTIKILNHPFRICGIVESGKGGRKLVPIETMGELMGADGKASLFLYQERRPGQRRPDPRRFTPRAGLENNAG